MAKKTKTGYFLGANGITENREYRAYKYKAASVVVNFI